MESFILVFFVLTLFVAGFLATQTIRRDLKVRGHAGADTRRESAHARPHASQGTLASPSLQRHGHKSPPRPL